MRYTSYSTSGKYTTWKAGLDWRINDALTFRTTQSRDIRAPTLDDLYAPQGVGRQTSTDLLTGQTPTVPLYTGGNPDLKAEIGRTGTAGVVWKSQSAAGIQHGAGCVPHQYRQCAVERAGHGHGRAERLL